MSEQEGNILLEKEEQQLFLLCRIGQLGASFCERMKISENGACIEGNRQNLADERIVVRYHRGSKFWRRLLKKEEKACNRREQYEGETIVSRESGFGIKKVWLSR